MKKIVYPALLSVAFASLLSGYFSTEFSRKHSFFLPALPKAEVLHLRAASLPARHLHALTIGRSVHPRLDSPAAHSTSSPESAAK